ncbi:type II and III secretion system protein family protein [Sandaracinobacteroides sp. A072]|uniref:type II and III secretion system protein family protein n=1 Tax=Sandaracinobacteroides sp. A072 TaxID=3461146 RepID=UPI00404354F1
MSIIQPGHQAPPIETRGAGFWSPGKAALALSVAAVLAMSGGIAPGAIVSPAMAQVTAAGDARTGAVMTVPVNKSQVLKLDRPFSRAMIGNPEIADVMPLSVNSVYLLGKANGSTNLALYDRRGDLIAVVDVVVGPDVLGLKRQVSEMFPGEDVRLSNSNESIVVEGQVSSPIAAERIVALAETHAPGKVLNLLSVGSPQQVLLEVRVSEMSRGTVKQLGINSFTWENSSTAGAVGAVPDLKFGPFSAALAVFGPGINVRLDALERQGLVRTLAQPNLVSLSGEPANFLAGGEFPVPVGVNQNGQLSIEFKQFGVSLAFTPTVLGDGLINLVVAPEVSSLDREASIQLNGYNIPGLKVRRAKTTLEMRDGQSFAIAGLIQQDFSDTVRAIPLLGKIPILGALFRSTDFNKAETELVITVTPRIVRPVKPGQLSLPTDSVLPPDPASLFLLGKTEKRAPQKPMSTLPGGIDGDHGHIVR